MKDKPFSPKNSTGSIPVISPILHCLSMPVLVFWRRSFGYEYLSPKSIFLSAVFATALLSYMVWNDADLKPQFYVLSLFFLASSAMYLIHLFCAIYKQARKIAEHDNYSGTSLLLDFVPSSQRSNFEPYIQGAIEPILTLLASFLLSQRPLGKILLIAGGALLFKELIRTWLDIRKKKGMADSFENAEDFADVVISNQEKSLSSTGRTGREYYRPQEDSEESD